MFNPTKFKGHYRIPSNRFSGYDYSQTGLYFVTICTKDRFPYFGNIIEGQMELSEIGKMAEECWINIPEHFPHAFLDEFVVMPNHVHGIVGINKDESVVETQNFASLRETLEYKNKFGPQSKNLSSIIRGFKIGVKKWATLNDVVFGWQPRFHDHIVRNEHSLQRIRQYILDNPMKWVEDELFIK